MSCSDLIMFSSTSTVQHHSCSPSSWGVVYHLIWCFFQWNTHTEDKNCIVQLLNGMWTHRGHVAKQELECSGFKRTGNFSQKSRMKMVLTSQQRCFRICKHFWSQKWRTKAGEMGEVPCMNQRVKMMLDAGCRSWWSPAQSVCTLYVSVHRTVCYTARVRSQRHLVSPDLRYLPPPALTLTASLPASLSVTGSAPPQLDEKIGVPG